MQANALNTEVVYEVREAAAGRDITPGMFSEFVAWIDRTEKTTRTYITNLRQFAAWMMYTGTRRPARADIIRYREWLGSDHDAVSLDTESAAGWRYRTDKAGNVIRVKCSANTVKQYLQSVRAFFSWTASEGIYANVAANVHAPKIDTGTHRKEALTVREVQLIEQSITTHGAAAVEAARGAVKDTAGRTQRADEQGRRLKAVYLLAVNAGMRTVEISRANVRDFVTRDGQAWIYIHGKGHADADAKKALAPEVAAAVSEYLASRADRPTGASPLFVSTGNRSGGRRIAETTISTMLKKAMQDAGINDERITAHSLRHTAGTCVMEVSGGNLYETQTYMRHANPRTTEIYLHRDTEKSDADTAARLYRYYHSDEHQDRQDRQDADSLENILQRLSPTQRQQLAGIAAAMA